MPGLSRAAELRQKRANLVSRMREITDNPGGEHGGLTDEQRAEFDRLHSAQEQLLADAQRIEDHEELEASLSGPAVPPAAGPLGTGGPEEAADLERDRQYAAAFGAYLRRGRHEITGEQRRVLERRSMVLGEERAMGTNDDALGGYTVPTTMAAGITEAMLAFGGMRQSRATILPTDSGADLVMVTDNDTSNEGAILTENSGTSEQETGFGQVILRSYVYSSKMIKVSRQLLADSAFDLESYLSRKLAQRLGRITNRHFTVGDGVSKPKGVAVGLTVGKTGATGQTTSIISDDLFDLEHSVDRDYRENAEWMMHDTSLRTLKKLKDGQGRPLWVPGIAVREPDMILGYRYIVNNNMATMAANAVSVIFGDMSLYHIRDVMGYVLLRLDERFADSFQVAFLGFSRHDGKLVDAGTNPIKSYVNSAS